MPIRPRRDGKTGCLGGLMYFVFVISLSVILACVGWMAASDVLALNKEYTEGTVTLPESIFTEKEIEVENEDGSVTQKTVMSADPVDPSALLIDAGTGDEREIARNRPLTRPRPGHADLPGMLSYDLPEARPVLERASARDPKCSGQFSHVVSFRKRPGSWPGL